MTRQVFKRMPTTLLGAKSIEYGSAGDVRFSFGNERFNLSLELSAAEVDQIVKKRRALAGLTKIKKDARH